MKKFPIDIDADDLHMEALGLCETQVLDTFMRREHRHMDETFMQKLVESYEEDGTLEQYTMISFGNFKAKKAAEYVMTQTNESGEKVIVGYFNLRIHKDVGDVYAWIAPWARKQHLFAKSLKAVEKTFFELGLSSLQTQCYFDNPYFPLISKLLTKSGHSISMEGTASLTWEKTADMWRQESEKTPETTQNYTKQSSIYEDELIGDNVTLKTYKLTLANVVALLNFAKSAPHEKGYRPSCLNVHNLTSALLALRENEDLKTADKFCNYFIHVDGNLAGVIALREERFDEEDDKLPGLSAEPRGRKAICLYWMHPAFRGKGYMSESLKLVQESFFTRDGTLLELDIYPDNIASQKVARKCGFACDALNLHYKTKRAWMAEQKQEYKIELEKTQIPSIDKTGGYFVTFDARCRLSRSGR